MKKYIVFVIYYFCITGSVHCQVILNGLGENKNSLIHPGGLLYFNLAKGELNASYNTLLNKDSNSKNFSWFFGGEIKAKPTEGSSNFPIFSNNNQLNPNGTLGLLIGRHKHTIVSPYRSGIVNISSDDKVYENGIIWRKDFLDKIHQQPFYNKLPSRFQGFFSNQGRQEFADDWSGVSPDQLMSKIEEYKKRIIGLGLNARDSSMLQQTAKQFGAWAIKYFNITNDDKTLLQNFIRNEDRYWRKIFKETFYKKSNYKSLYKEDERWGVSYWLDPSQIFTFDQAKEQLKKDPTVSVEENFVREWYLNQLLHMFLENLPSPYKKYIEADFEGIDNVKAYVKARSSDYVRTSAWYITAQLSGSKPKFAENQTVPFDSISKKLITEPLIGIGYNHYKGNKYVIGFLTGFQRESNLGNLQNGKITRRTTTSSLVGQDTMTTIIADETLDVKIGSISYNDFIFFRLDYVRYFPLKDQDNEQGLTNNYLGFNIYGLEKFGLDEEKSPFHFNFGVAAYFFSEGKFYGGLYAELQDWNSKAIFDDGLEMGLILSFSLHSTNQAIFGATPTPSTN